MKTVTIKFKPCDSVLSCTLKVGTVYLKAVHVNIVRDTGDRYYFNLSRKRLQSIFDFCEQKHVSCLTDSSEDFYKIRYQF